MGTPPPHKKKQKKNLGRVILPASNILTASGFPCRISPFSHTTYTFTPPPPQKKKNNLYREGSKRFTPAKVVERKTFRTRDFPFLAPPPSPPPSRYFLLVLFQLLNILPGLPTVFDGTVPYFYPCTVCTIWYRKCTVVLAMTY